MPSKRERQREASRRRGHSPTTLQQHVSPPVKADIEPPDPQYHAVQSPSSVEVAKPHGYAVWLKDWSPIFLNALVFGAILYQAHIYNKQWEVMDKQWNTMEKSLRVSQRAYVTVHSVVSNWQAGYVEIILENIGKVPADDVTAVDVQTTRVNESGTEITEGQTIKQRHDKLFPGNFKMSILVPLEGYTLQESDLIRANKEKIMIGGRIRYGDGFGNLDETVFDFQYLPPPVDKWEDIPILTRSDVEAGNDQRK